MPERLRAAMKAWQHAEEEARAAENLLLAAWEEATSRQGMPTIAPEIIDSALRLRDRANDKFMVALSLLRR